MGAIKEIKVGEEVTASYIAADIATFGRRKEKDIHFENWSFNCRCDICLEPETDQIKKLRNEWIEIQGRFEAMKRSKEQSKIFQTFLETLDQQVDLIIKVDKQYLF